MEPTLRVRVLGPLELLGDNGQRVDIGGHRQRRLLAKLVMHRAVVVPTDELIDAVWSAADRPQSAERALRTYVSRLRKAFDQAGAGPGAEVLATAPPGYRLTLPADVTDAERLATLVHATERARGDGELDVAIEAADRARALWRGRPYAEFAEEAWARREVQRLEELAATAEEERAEVLLGLGRHETLVAELERLTAEHPARERLRSQLMVALYRSGRQADALQSFQRYRASLIERSGLEPSAAIRALEARIATADPSLAVPDPDGRPLRAYRLVERSGEGSFAVVWRGTQPALGREVAVKQIRAELANRPEFIRRFEAEAHLVARLEHPHIVPLYDYWREPGSAYLIMRWLRGGTLEARVAEGPLSLQETKRLAREVGAALSHAHRAGVVHRDVKPANVLLDGEGNFFLGDFGIALETSDLFDPEAALSAGSPAYAAPEQLRREAVGPQADVHGLGIMLYEALTATLPFPEERTQAALLHRQLHDPIPSVGPLRPDLPDSLAAAIDRVIGRATAKNPGDRYESVAELIEQFATAVSPAGPAGPARTRAAAGAATRIGQLQDNPYKGLRAFSEADAAEFFGRDRLVDRMVQHLHRDGPAGRLLVAVGPSGSGKSSVVRAGLLPALRAGRVTGSQRWFVTTMVPGAHPFEELESALARVATDRTSGWAEALVADERGIARAAKQLLPEETSELVIVVDQFEELFTLCLDEGVQRRFVRALAEAVTDPRSRVRLIVAIRADFWDRPLRHPELAALFGDAAQVVGPLAADELERAIVEPAARVGADFEPGLVSQIIADVADQPGALPMLQYALTELFERHASGLLLLDTYRHLGGVVGALARRAEELYAEAHADRQDAIRRLFLRLVSQGEGTEDTRRRVLRSELPSDQGTQAAIDAFGDARLLSFDRDPLTREPTVEVAHEALLREWPRLRSWLDEDRDGRRLHRHLTDAAQAWNGRGRDPGDFYRGGRLSAAGDWVSAHPDELNELEQSFLNASRAAQDRAEAELHQRNVRLRRSLRGVAVLAVAALVAAGLALIAQQRANRSAEQSRAATELAEEQRLKADTEAERANAATTQADLTRLTAQARAEVNGNRSLAMLLGIEANRIHDDVATRSAVLNGLVAEPRHVASLPGVAGRQLLTTTAEGLVVGLTLDGTVQVWDPKAESPLITSWKAPGFDALEESSTVWDQRVLLSQTGTAQVFDLRSGAPLGSAIEHLTPAVTLSADGSRVFELRSSPAGNEVAAFDVITGAPLPTIATAAPAGTPIALRVSQDGQLLVGQVLDPATSQASTLVWDLAMGGPPKVLGQAYLGLSPVISPSGRYVAVHATLLPARFSVYRVQDGAAMLSNQVVAGNVVRSVFAPDENTRGVGGGNGHRAVLGPCHGGRGGRVERGRRHADRCLHDGRHLSGGERRGGRRVRHRRRRVPWRAPLRRSAPGDGVGSRWQPRRAGGRGPDRRVG